MQSCLALNSTGSQGWSWTPGFTAQMLNCCGEFFWDKPPDTNESGRERPPDGQKPGEILKGFGSQVHFAFSFYTLKHKVFTTQGGGRNASKISQKRTWQLASEAQWPIASPVPPHHSVPSCKWSHAQQIDSASSALSKSLSKSLNTYLITGLFYLMLLQDYRHDLPCPVQRFNFRPGLY